MPSQNSLLDQPQIPSSIDLPGFECLRLLARGSTNNVILANQLSLDRNVAIRLYSQESSEDEDFKKEVTTMAQAMARLNHANLIGIFNSGVHEGMLYTIMEFIPGKSLERSLRGESIAPEIATSICLSICDGLSHAHENEICHGALDAGYVLLNSDASPKIGNFRGHYSKKNVIHDIHSVGKILYQMLTGSPCTEHSVHLSKIAGVPENMAEIWSRACHRDHPDAYCNISELQEDLKHCSCPKTSPGGKGKGNQVLLAKAPSAAVPNTTVVSNPVLKTPASTSVLRPMEIQRPASPAGVKTLQTSLPNDSPLPSVKPTTVVKSGSNMALVRNIFIIILLLVAIHFVMDARKRKAKDIRAQEAAALAEKPIVIVKKPEPTHPHHGASAHSHKPTTVPKEPAPTPIAAPKNLEELRSDLANGQRDTLPEGTQTRGECAYYMLDGEYSWPEACWLAEQHGAHLAIPSAQADLGWLTDLASGKPFWLGLAKNSRTNWSMLDGKSWKPSKEPGGLGIYLAADKFGFLRGANNHVRLPCILQWHMDGSNPCSLETILSTTGNTTNSPNVVYPPGSHFVSDRVYYVVSRDVTWQEAKRLAELAGGSLAVISEVAESVYIEELATNLHDDQLYWLGGRFQNNQWEWITNEPWSRSIAPDGPTSSDTCLTIAANGKTQASTSAQGFIIEWSKDGK